MGLGVSGLGGLGFRVQALRFRVWALGFKALNPQEYNPEYVIRKMFL